MHFIIAGDSHGYTERLDELKQIQADGYIFTGDLTDDPARISGWSAVAGNNDQYFGIKLPLMTIVDAGDHKILVMHGHQFPAGQRHRRLATLAKKFGCDIAVYGHSHVPVIDEEDGVLILNPGSVYRSRDGKGTSYTILDTSGHTPRAEIIRKKFAS
ncbi:metallophosphoesterase family protein [Faecalibaculum rodentium]|uniref:metallophosphoesterase family protein n=1 Tax=Faecalibaculum rodentium TaxID=1702221 RepID=UPI002577CB41|nr:YfcE family phosphodiesterase [Faecalibaculum rodentium]